jgi:methionyl aminopeptidase
MNSKTISIKNPDQIQLMRNAGKACCELLDYLAPHILPGMCTESIDQLAVDFISNHGWIAAPFGYAPPGHAPFPKSLCTSINHQVCHGIPGTKIIAQGDLVKIDCTVIVNGWHGDSCRSFICPSKNKTSHIAATRLSDLTHQAMWEGIGAAKAGRPLSDIGHAIELFAKKHGLGIVKNFTGHGIGQAFHEAPSVKNFYDPDDAIILEPGMCITVEPMLCTGSGAVSILPDGWTVITKDRTLCAQWEHTIAILKDRTEILTLSEHHPPPHRFSQFLAQPAHP